VKIKVSLDHSVVFLCRVGAKHKSRDFVGRKDEGLRLAKKLMALEYWGATFQN